MASTVNPATAQEERTARALEALRTNAFQIVWDGQDAWSVKNGGKNPYQVKREEGIWSCTCPDFTQRGPAIRCKHIEAIRLSIEDKAGDINLSTNHKEQTMSNTPENPSDRIRWELRQPLDMTRVKRRQAPGLGSVPYLEGFDVIERANEIFSFVWSFELVKEPMIMRWQKTQTYYSQQHRRKMPVLDDQGKPVTEEVGMVWVTGKVTAELDGKNISHSDVGRCIFSGDTPEALDMAVAGAATDCLKRCFRQFGEQFGNSLYDKEIAQTAGLENAGHPTGQTSGNGHSTAPSGSNGTSSPSTPRGTSRTSAAGTPSVADAGKVVFTLKPKSRPELTGKTLAELQSLAPDILTWLANEYNATPETQGMKDAAQVLVTSKTRESKILSELGFAN
ncbi:MAG TPA: Rad52/Rad22 family DNA repair protein [Bellilinea sp.]|nr:Rad52/Rad22 family DNA repair protein [Bellilinea sp.]